MKKSYASHQPGVSYAAAYTPTLEIDVKNENGKTLSHRFVLSDDYKELKPGDNVTVLSFIDRPVWNKQTLE